MTLRVKEPFACSDGNDGMYVFAEGDLIDDNHPAVKNRKELFESIQDFTERTKQRPVTAAPVEQATAAPGEKRAAARHPAKG